MDDHPLTTSMVTGPPVMPRPGFVSPRMITTTGLASTFAMTPTVTSYPAPVQPDAEKGTAQYSSPPQKVNLKGLYALGVLLLIFAMAILALVAYNADTSVYIRSNLGKAPSPAPAPAPAGKAASWDYSDTTKWGGTCATGKSQSPINIVKADAVSGFNSKINLGAFTDVSLAMGGNVFAKMSQTEFNGYGVITNGFAGSYFKWNDVDYKLLQFHWHAHAEFTVDGTIYDLDCHFVHQNSNGALLVIGFFLNKGGSSSPKFIADIAGRTSSDKNQPATFDMDITQVWKDIGIGATSTPYWSFSGSLTTPPCSEGVTFLILQNPVLATDSDVEQLKKLNKGNNFRPVQPLNGRVVQTHT